MNPLRLQQLLESVAHGSLSPADAAAQLATLPFEVTDEACIDHHRSLRCGFPEVIFGGGKSPQQLIDIIGRITARAETVLATRVTADAAEQVRATYGDASYHSTARVLIVGNQPEPPDDQGFIAVVAAGTSDLPVAEEARLTALALGQAVRSYYDVGVAGLHRLLARLTELRQANAIVVVAGMEGALPSVVGGLVDTPIIAVPTSVGYGASFQGLAALLAMLNTCASGVSVVNIDNGFGAAYQAALINRRIYRKGPAGKAAATLPPSEE